MHEDRLGTPPEQLTFIAAIVLTVLLLWVVPNSWTALRQLQANSNERLIWLVSVTSPALVGGLVAILARVFTTRYRQWRLRLASPLGWVLLSGSVGLDSGLFLHDHRFVGWFLAVALIPLAANIFVWRARSG